MWFERRLPPRGRWIWQAWFLFVISGALASPTVSPAEDLPPTAHAEELPADASRPGAKPEKLRVGVVAGDMEARLADGSVLKLALLDSHLQLKTAYGELRIPWADIRRIEFATRIDEERSQQIAAAIADLGHDEYEARERASQKLAGLGGAAYPALFQAAAESDDLEVVNRAEELLAAIRQALPAELYEVRADDVVHTANSKIAGRIEATTLSVATEPFGKQDLKIALLRSIRSADAGAAGAKNVLPDPGTLSKYQGQADQVLSFKVTGGAAAAQLGRRGMSGGAVWGTDFYTLDSTLAMAAVHAGVVPSGETRVVTVAILGPQHSFEGSTRNGVTTASWGQFPGAFKFLEDADLP